MSGNELRATPDVAALTADMQRFAELLKLVARPGPELGRKYEAYAASLEADPSPLAVEEAREWISLTLQNSGNNSVFDRYVSVNGSVDGALTAEYLRLAGKLREFGAETRATVKPSGDLLPKLPNMLLLIPLAFGPVIAMVFTGIAMENSEGTAKNLLTLLSMFLFLVTMAAVVIIIKTGLTARRKLAAAGERIARSLVQEHGIAVERPGMLVLNEGKARLSPYELRAIDAYNRPVYITVGMDETGTKVLPASVRLVPESELL